MITHRILVPALGLALLTVGGCDAQVTAPAVGSDSQQHYASDRIPVDTGIYTVTGEVTGQVNDITRQIKPATGSFSAYGSFASGTYFGPTEAGKGFVRIRVTGSDVDIAPKGDLVVLKVTDTKASALVEGDVVVFKCRKQYENVAAVQDNEKLDTAKAATWELDYCRLATPKVDVR